MRSLRLLLSLFVLPATAVSAQFAATSQQGRRLAIEDWYRVKTVGSPEISPDGRWVAFTVGTRVEETNGETTEVWAVPTDGSSAARRVSPDGSNAGTPRWSPEGRIRFQTDRKSVV